MADFPETSFEEWAALCDAVGSDGKDTLPELEVQSDVPVLILAGKFDDRSPAAEIPAWSSGLTRAKHVILDAMSHDVLWTECGLEVALAYLRDPDIVEVDMCDAATRIDWQ